MDINQNYNSSTSLAQWLFQWAQRFSSLVPNIQRQSRVANSTPITKYPSLNNSINTSVKSLGALTTNYGDSTRYEKYHPGIDIANKIWTPIPSFSGGTVERIENNKSWFGNSVLVKDDQGNELRYSHLQQAYVKPGQRIAKWSEIGVMWASGSTYSTSGWSGSHLDLRIMNAYKKYINPFTYLNQNG